MYSMYSRRDNMDDKDILKKGQLQIVCEDAYSLAKNDPNAFSMLRRNGFGASDNSVFLGLNKWTKIEELIAQKQATEITPEEKLIGEKPVVRKGSDLEPLILQKFAEFSGMEVYKPNAMYSFVEHPWLTINYDGVLDFGDDVLIPVEAKFVSTYADKYWDTLKAIPHIGAGNPVFMAGHNPVDVMEATAKQYGIPGYYYSQLQQQLMGLNAPFGYMAALFDKTWELKVFKIFAEPYTKNQILTVGKEIWDKVGK